MRGSKYELEDRMYRSLGILKSAILLSTNECLKLLSYVRLGVEMGIIKDVNKGLLNSILVEMQPANIQNKCNKALSSTERDINRAKFIREKLTSSTTAK